MNREKCISHENVEEKQKKYYVLRLDSYSGGNSSLQCEADGQDRMFCVLLVSNGNAEIIDMGYSSLEQLLATWKNIHFVNLEKML